MLEVHSCIQHLLAASFFWCKSDMDCTDAFDSLCVKVGMSGPIVEALKKRGFATPAGFFWPLKDGADATLKAILDASGIDLSNAASKLQSQEAGCLRRLLHECRMLCELPVVVPAAAPQPPKATSTLLGLDMGPH